MYSLLRSLACALLLAPSLLPAAETQRFVLERPYQVAGRFRSGSGISATW